jgi:hypothetical protein
LITTGARLGPGRRSQPSRYAVAIASPQEDHSAPGGQLFADAADDDTAARLVAELRAETDELREQLEAAFGEVVGHLERAEGAQRSTHELVQEVLATLQAAVDASREPQEQGTAAVDLEPVAARLDQLDEVAAATFRELVRLQEVPLSIDTSRLEDVASRGSLHNAADIANLRRDVEALTESARAQEKALRELKATLEWVKDRMLR